MTFNTFISGLLISIALTASVQAQELAPSQLINELENLTPLFSSNPAGIFGNPFFSAQLGTNGRACVTCHQPTEAMSVTPAGIQERFALTAGLDPIFRTNDGSNCYGKGGTTIASRKLASSLLLNKGLFRIELPLPAGAEFSFVSVDDPYRCSSLAASGDLSMYRRPLPAANLKFISTVMWDGRETLAGSTIAQDLSDQATGAVAGHAQGATIPSSHELGQIVGFETDLFAASPTEAFAGALSADGAQGGAENLSRQEFFIGINDPATLAATGATAQKVFDIYDGWKKYDDGSLINRIEPLARARASIERGQEIFNTRSFSVAIGGGKTIQASCVGCHDSPNAGSHSVESFFNIGVAAASARTSDLPLFTFVCNTTGATVQVSDPGRAMISGKCADLGSFKPPVLRGLASRAPYFHNGMAAQVEDVVDFYDQHFSIGFTAAEKSDLAAFLKAL